MSKFFSSINPTGPSIFYLMNATKGDRPHYFLDLTQDYGDIVKVPSPIRTYLINNPDYIQYILKEKPRQYRKGGIGLKPVMAALGKGLLVNMDQEWEQRRHLLAPFFFPKAIANFTQVITETTRLATIHWQQYYENKQYFDINHEMMRIVLQCTLKILFNKQIDDKMCDDTIDHFANVNFYSASLLCILPWLPTLNNYRYRKSHYFIQQFVKQLIDEHQKQLPTEPDIVTAMLTAQQEQNLSEQDVIDELKTFLATGHETTGVALSWAWYLLCNHSEAYQKLLAEVRTVLADRDATSDDLIRLNYTRMVIEETLRLYPPIWMLSRKNNADDEIGGKFIAKNSDILICTYALHRTAKYWPKPECFIPERFSKENRAGHHRFSFIPFGGGERVCIASFMGITMAQLILATISQQYELEWIQDQAVDYDHLISLRPKHGIWVRVKRSKKVRK